MYKCKICGKKYKDLACLYNHLESKHADVIPQNMSVQQFYYYTKTGKMNGNCVMCKHPTTWNMNTNKYNRFCGDPKCKAKYVEIMKGRMIAKYGKAHLLNDPNKQREMLANRSISGTYEWSDGKHKTTYTGSYELDFLKTLDNFFEWDPEDISMPSPHTYTYEYEGERKFYIPDVFIHSLDLEIEIKDGGDNPNRHHKIQDVDKVKERLKDEVLTSQRNFHYVKITNKNYSNFFDFLKEVKSEFEKYGDDKKIPRIFKTEDIRIKGDYVKESYEELDLLNEGFARDVVEKIDEFNKKTFRESDLLLSLRYDLVKGSPKELQDFLLQLIKGAKYKDDLVYVNELVGRSETYYYNLLKKRPEIKGEYNDYHNWTYTGMRKEMKNKLKKIGESVEEFEFLEEKFEPDKFLIWFDKPIKKLLNRPIRLYHATLVDSWNIGDIIEPGTIHPGTTKLSVPRMTNYFWDNIKYAPQWGLCKVLRDFLRNGYGEVSYPCSIEMKLLVKLKEGITEKMFFDTLLKQKYCFYIYEVIVNTNKLEMGPVDYIKEYTISEPVKIVNKNKIIVDREILKKWVFVADNDEKENEYMKELSKHIRSVRGLTSLFIDSNRDFFRPLIYKDLLDKYGNKEIDELKNIDSENVFKDYRNRINKSIRAGFNDRLLETPEDFDLLEEKFEPDKFLVWFDKPVRKLVGGKLRVYHGTNDLIINEEFITPMSFNVGATKHSDPRWSTYVWDNKEDAMQWASAWAVSNHHRETLYIGHNGKTMLGKPDGMEDKEFVKQLIEKMSKAKFYIYECEVDIKDLEIGSCPSIKEYTVSKPIKVLKRYDYTLNKEIVRRCFNILPVDEVIKFKEQNKGVKHLKLHRNMILNHVLDNTRDSYRAVMRTDLQQGNIKVGDDLSGYKDSINYHVKRDTYGLKESYITDIMEESSISMVQLNLYLQNQYEEEMKHYLDTYKQYYEIMRKEKPHAVKNLNEDIKRAIIFIDGLASKGVENNLVQFAREELGNIVNIPKRGNAVKIHESTDVLNLKLIYENSNARSLFGLADTKTQLVVNDEFIIKRDKMGNHCSVSILENVMNADNIIEFEIKFNNSLDFDNYLKENMNEGISLNTMFNFRDEEYKFIKEACLKLFGNYPESINKK